MYNTDLNSVTLHQPRSDIYHGIDNVVVLAKGGRLAYSGPRADVGRNLADAGYPIPLLFNPADHLLDTVYSKDTAKTIVDFWEVRQEKLIEQAAQKEYATIDPDILTSTRERTPFFIALFVLIGRMTKNLWRQQPGAYKYRESFACLLTAYRYSVLGSITGTSPTHTMIIALD
jgi:hypothetical protein